MIFQFLTFNYCSSQKSVYNSIQKQDQTKSAEIVRVKKYGYDYNSYYKPEKIKGHDQDTLTISDRGMSAYQHLQLSPEQIKNSELILSDILGSFGLLKLVSENFTNLIQKHSVTYKEEEIEKILVDNEISFSSSDLDFFKSDLLGITLDNLVKAPLLFITTILSSKHALKAFDNSIEQNPKSILKMLYYLLNLKRCLKSESQFLEQIKQKMCHFLIYLMKTPDIFGNFFHQTVSDLLKDKNFQMLVTSRIKLETPQSSEKYQLSLFRLVHFIFNKKKNLFYYCNRDPSKTVLEFSKIVVIIGQFKNKDLFCFRMYAHGRIYHASSAVLVDLTNRKNFNTEPVRIIHDQSNGSFSVYQYKNGQKILLSRDFGPSFFLMSITFSLCG